MGNLSTKNQTTFPTAKELEKAKEEKLSNEVDACVNAVKKSAGNGESSASCLAEHMRTIGLLELRGFDIKRVGSDEINSSDILITWSKRNEEGPFIEPVFGAYDARILERANKIRRYLEMCKDRIINGHHDCPIVKGINPDEVIENLEKAGFVNVGLGVKKSVHTVTFHFPI